MIEESRVEQTPPDPSASDAEESSVTRLAAWIEQHLSKAGTTSMDALVPDPSTLAAYPPEIAKAVIEASTRAFDAELDLRRQHLELIRERVRVELRRIELEHDRVEREIKLAEHRIDADVKLRQTAARTAASSLADRQSLGLRLAVAGLAGGCVLGVFASPWIGGAIALASLASWLVSQRGVHRGDPAVPALPAPLPALPQAAHDKETEQ
jgi:hypothetical protein